jgi:hypothetical protein
MAAAPAALPRADCLTTLLRCLLPPAVLALQMLLSRGTHTTAELF